MAVSATLAAAPAMAADGIQPGLWKITTTVLNNGAQMPPQTKPRCLTAGQAGDRSRAAPGLFQNRARRRQRGDAVTSVC